MPTVPCFACFLSMSHICYILGCYIYILHMCRFGKGISSDKNNIDIICKHDGEEAKSLAE